MYLPWYMFHCGASYVFGISINSIDFGSTGTSNNYLFILFQVEEQFYHTVGYKYTSTDRFE